MPEHDVPRLRFAPSPTGTLHVGNLHTALFSWALARALGGDFILRIEDTDPVRNVIEAVRPMFDALAWLGIDWDEGPDIGGDYGPYVQSERLPRHQEVAAQLVAAGHAYYGDDPENPAGPEGNPLRLRMTRSGETVLQDAIRGPIVFTHSQRTVDPVLVRSDGRPLYHLAAMVDDYDMGITHVLRGEEYIPTSPIHIRLYQAMGWREPVWVHLPLIINKQGQKLSKRDPEGGYLISDFQEVGYLPEALFNYLLLLGWAPDGEQEIISKYELRRQFRIERLGASPAVFDWDKLNWVNRQYIARHGDEALAGMIRPFLEDIYGPLPGNEAWLVQLTALLREGLVRLSDAVELAEWALSDAFEVQPEAQEVLAAPESRPVLAQLVAELAHVVLLDAQTAGGILKGLRDQMKKSHGLSAKQVYWPIRAALIGSVHGPPAADIMAILGKERCLQRVAATLKS